jgi:4-alpha-glucanotransferase
MSGGRRPHLQTLAERVGILPSYTAASSGEERQTSDATRVGLLAAMGLDGDTEAAAADALRTLTLRDGARLLEPALVVRHGSTDRGVAVRLPVGSAAPVEWSLELNAEDGRSERAEGRSDPLGKWVLRLPIPGAPLPPGYHSLRVTVERAGRHQEARQTLIVAPSRCTRVADQIGEHRAFGLWANLYSVRSTGGWGTGDIGDLRSLLVLRPAGGRLRRCESPSRTLEPG